MKSLCINWLLLQQVGPYNDTKMAFSKGLNIVCGPNGIGKTTILEAIISPFGGIFEAVKLKKNASFIGGDGRIVLNIEAEGNNRESEAGITSSDPSNDEKIAFFSDYSSSIINIRTRREITYAKSTSINSDPTLSDFAIGSRNIVGTDSTEIKGWLANRYLFSAAGEQGWTDSDKANYALAVNLFSILDHTVKLHNVNHKSFDVLVETPDGIIPFEWLSSGFRSTYALLFGVIKEIEFRQLNISASAFTGVILIDEIDLHLHPDWQRKIARVLKETFPLAQIIATTHSPHVIQSVDVSEVIALWRSEPGRIGVRTLPDSPYGFSGWTVEEVLTDVMGMQQVETQVYSDAVKAFDDAVESEDGRLVRESLFRLHLMLHPTSFKRTLFDLRAAPFIGANLD
ncbi:AAA family ATPase [Sphingomonas sp. MMS24-J45]|uniref:AAA family ATPase n=1 Tax=Sphingomonas sp. MMS24-J45 TaxID=3238806 RepID=UPI00384D33D9